MAVNGATETFNSVPVLNFSVITFNFPVTTKNAKLMYSVLR